MPYAKRPGRTTKKVYKPRKGGANKSTFKPSKDFRFKADKNYGIKPEPFPRVLFTRLKYGQSNKFNVPVLGVAVANSYRMNSIWDPDFTGVGLTVAGWSQMSALYDRYMVMGAKVIVSFNDPSADGIRVGCSLRQASNGPTSGLTIEQLTYYNNTYISGLNNTGKQTKNFSFYIKPWSLIGIDKLEYMANSSLYSSTMASFPSAPCYIDVFAVNEDPTAAAKTVLYTIKIIYYTKCYQRKQLNP